MISYLLQAPRSGNAESEQERIRAEQRLNSLSSEDIERLYSRDGLRSGLIKFTLVRPEHKLRDLARIVLGKSSAELGELDIYQVARLFFVRRMTFTLDQIANVAYRRMRECGANGLINPESHEDLVKSEEKALFLVHDEEENVSVVMMENKKNYFPCTVTPVKEGALFENEAMPVILRHPNPYILWRLWRPNKLGSDEVGTTKLKLEETRKISVHPGMMVELEEDRKNAAEFAKKVLKAYAMPNLNVKVGFGILAPSWQRTNDDRPLFGLPNEDIEPDETAIAMDFFVAELRCAMAQMDECMDLPPQSNETKRSINTKKLKMILDCGLTFSIREAGMFMRNAPRRNDGDDNVTFVHDEEGEVFLLRLGYKNRALHYMAVSQACLNSDYTHWSTGTNFCIRTPFMDRTLIIAQASITNHVGEYKFGR